MARYTNYEHKTKPDDMDTVLISDNEQDPDTLKQIYIKSLFETYDSTAFDGAYKTVKAAIESKMTRSTYDANNNGIVDNAEKVNNHSVNKDVPSDAKFTDTVYDDTEVRKLAKACVATTPSFSSLPQTYYDAALTFEGSVNHITSDMIVKPEDYIASNPSAMGGDWTITTYNGYLTVSGTFSGTTGTTLKLFFSHE